MDKTLTYNWTEYHQLYFHEMLWITIIILFLQAFEKFIFVLQNSFLHSYLISFVENVLTAGIRIVRIPSFRISGIFLFILFNKLKWQPLHLLALFWIFLVFSFIFKMVYFKLSSEYLKNAFTYSSISALKF